MSLLKTVFLRGLAVALPSAAGVVAIMLSGAISQAPESKGKSPTPTPVRVLTLAPVEVVPRVIGYGAVGPAREWRAVARIDGEVVETAPNLANGESVSAGTPLLRIDDTDLRLALAQTDAQLRALDVKDETLRASRALSQSDLELSEAELARQRTLQDQGVATQSRLEQADRAVLAARAKVTEIDNQMALNAAEREVLTAQRDIARRSLDFTTIRAPYDLRIGAVSAELGQVVTRGATLFTAEGTEAAEIAAQFPLGRMAPVVRALGPEAQVSNLRAVVRLPVPGHIAEWPATVMRVGEAIDARTQSANIVVRVDRPLDLAKPGLRPPLRRNMYVEVELSAPARQALVIPAEAISAGRVLLVGADDRLEARSIVPAYAIGGLAIVTEGLAAGDRLVVTDPTLAIPGMAVTPVEDARLAAAIAAEAMGGGAGE